jgi:hypothetical protein
MKPDTSATSAPTRTAPAGPRRATRERRTRRRFRELCDEVLASFRVAKGEDLWSDSDRSELQATLGRIVPRPLGARAR